MSTIPIASGNAGRLADRLVAARRDRFVGREAELTLFRTALLHIYGPGGVGKTALIRSYAQLARESGRTVIHLDSRNLEASPSGFLFAMRQALGHAEDERQATTPAYPPAGVLLHKHSIQPEMAKMEA